MKEAGCEHRIVARVALDITDLSRFPDRSFDGGPLSYVFDRADDALAEMLRVTRPGGYVLLSVSSLAPSSTSTERWAWKRSGGSLTPATSTA